MTSRVGRLVENLLTDVVRSQGLKEMDDDYADGIGDRYQIICPKEKIDEWIGPFEHEEWLTRRGLAKILHQGLDGKYCVEHRVTYYSGNKFCTLGLKEKAANDPFKDKTFLSYYVLTETGRIVLVPAYFLKSVSDEQWSHLFPQGFPGYSYRG